MSRADHRVSWTDGSAAFHCAANDDAACRFYPECDDETWPCGHPPRPGLSCWLLPWLSNCSPEETYHGAPPEPGEPASFGVPVRDSAIETNWTGDYLEWRYAS